MESHFRKYMDAIRDAGSNMREVESLVYDIALEHDNGGISYSEYTSLLLF